MSLRLGDKAPNFKAKTSIGEIDFYEYLGDNWGILFSHPADYTPVCTTELGMTAALKGEFAKRGVKVLALSVDPVDKHLGWIKDINETQKVNVDFPIIADEDRKVSTLYEFIHPNASATATVRSLVIIGPDKAVKLIITYPASTGRNFPGSVAGGGFAAADGQSQCSHAGGLEARGRRDRGAGDLDGGRAEEVSEGGQGGEAVFAVYTAAESLGL